jgi:hypothetical protein
MIPNFNWTCSDVIVVDHDNLGFQPTQRTICGCILHGGQHITWTNLGSQLIIWMRSSIYIDVRLRGLGFLTT